MHIRRVARRPVADGHAPRSSDSGDGGDGSEYQERGTHRPRPQQRVSGLNAHVGPFLGDRGLNSAGRFGSAIAGSNLPAAPWCWRHSLIDDARQLGIPRHVRRAPQTGCRPARENGKLPSADAIVGPNGGAWRQHHGAAAARSARFGLRPTQCALPRPRCRAGVAWGRARRRLAARR